MTDHSECVLFHTSIVLMKLAVAQQTLEYVSVFEALECIRNTDPAHERYDSMMGSEIIFVIIIYHLHYSV